MIIGRLGQKPEHKVIPSGSEVANFSVATSESWKDKNGQKQEKTEWHRVIVWGKMAGVCSKYLDKGSSVYIEGKLQTRSWQDKDGATKYVTEVLASNVQFLGAPKSQQGQSNNGYEPPSAGGGFNDSFPPQADEDIPF